MTFETYAGAFSVDAVDQLPVAYLARQQVNNIALMDTLTLTAPVEWCAYRCHVVTGEANKRDLRKRSRRIIVYGTGVVTGGQIILCADNNRTESYPFVPINLAGTYANQQELITQGTNGLTGIVFDVTMVLFGIGIVVNDIELEWTPIG